MQNSCRSQFLGCGYAIATQLYAKQVLCVASHNKAIKYAPFGRPTLLRRAVYGGVQAVEKLKFPAFFRPIHSKIPL
jgi:hypothetical protein